MLIAYTCKQYKVRVKRDFKIMSTIQMSALPSNVPSLCIPRVFANITQERVVKTFNQLGLGAIDHIDMITREGPNGQKFQRVFVHFRAWASSVEAQNVRQRMLEGKEIKIIYDEPWFWKVSANRSQPRNNQGHPRDNQGQPRNNQGQSRNNQQRPIQRRRPAPIIEFDDRLQERKEQKKVEQQQQELFQPTSPESTPPPSPLREEEKEEEEQEEDIQQEEVQEEEAGILLSYPDPELMKKPAKRVRKLPKKVTLKEE